MTRQSVVWLVAWTASLLVVGCAPQPDLATSDIATRLPTSTVTRMSTPTVTRMSTPTVTKMSSPTVTPELTSVSPSTKEERTVTFTVVYDNNEYDPALRTAWGFSCWVEAGGATVLFDTGGDGATLLGNMAELGLDPQAIDVVVLSHVHGDHTGGLAGLLDTGARPTVYVPAAFPGSFKADVRARTSLVEVTKPIEVSSGVYTTGQVGSGIVEQALIVETGVGSVIITGCAHPGIVEMVSKGKEVTPGKVALVLGGFHLGGASRGQVEDIVSMFRQLGVQRVAPCHCTGDRARRVFVDAYGMDCTLAGVGWAGSVGSGQ
jgi:7,8-dihydropterin-6-yl-methyl-4-(beta-D-ribofuranosyl)aminobenzene 5'-phosphate synthase